MRSLAPSVTVTECASPYRLPVRSPNLRRHPVSSIRVYHEAVFHSDQYFFLPLNMYKAPSSPRQRPLSRSSSTDEDSQPLIKRPRLSEEDDEDEEPPLAFTARMNLSSALRSENGAKSHPSRHAGKGTSAMSTAHTAPMSIPPPSGDMLAEMNGEIFLPSTSEVAVKVEEQMDEGQLDRLATGVTVDTAIASSSDSVWLPCSWRL
jgi:hypothetical protein